MTPTIRRATETDIPAITTIYNHAVEHSSATYDHLPVTVEHRLRWFEERQAAGLPVLVAASGAEVLGWANYGPYRPRLGYSRTAEHSVYLAPEARGRRLGGQLLGSIITLASPWQRKQVSIPS